MINNGNTDKLGGFNKPICYLHIIKTLICVSARMIMSQNNKSCRFSYSRSKNFSRVNYSLINGSDRKIFDRYKPAPRVKANNQKMFFFSGHQIRFNESVNIG